LPAIRYPTRYRRVPHGPREFAQFHAECAALLDRATELDNAQQALSLQLANCARSWLNSASSCGPASTQRTSCTGSA